MGGRTIEEGERAAQKKPRGHTTHQKAGETTSPNGGKKKPLHPTSVHRTPGSVRLPLKHSRGRRSRRKTGPPRTTKARCPGVGGRTPCRSVFPAAHRGHRGAPGRKRGEAALRLLRLNWRQAGSRARSPAGGFGGIRGAVRRPTGREVTMPLFQEETRPQRGGTRSSFLAIRQAGLGLASNTRG